MVTIVENCGAINYVHSPVFCPQKWGTRPTVGQDRLGHDPSTLSCFVRRHCRLGLIAENGFVQYGAAVKIWSLSLRVSVKYT